MRHLPAVLVGALLLVLVFALVASGCGTSGSGTTIILYSAQHEQTTDAMIAAFTKQTGIHVRVEQNDEDVLTAQLEQEGELLRPTCSTPRTPTGSNSWATSTCWPRSHPPRLPPCPSRMSAANGDWVGVSARISVLIYNTSKLKPSELPKSVMELADPKWRGKIEIAPGETDLWPVISSIARAYGRGRRCAG